MLLRYTSKAHAIGVIKIGDRSQVQPSFIYLDNIPTYRLFTYFSLLSSIVTFSRDGLGFSTKSAASKGTFKHRTFSGAGPLEASAHHFYFYHRAYQKRSLSDVHPHAHPC